jgi:hypothetical protein
MEILVLRSSSAKALMHYPFGLNLFKSFEKKKVEPKGMGVRTLVFRKNDIMDVFSQMPMHKYPRFESSRCNIRFSGFVTFPS